MINSVLQVAQNKMDHMPTNKAGQKAGYMLARNHLRMRTSLIRMQPKVLCAYVLYTRSSP